MSARFSLEVPPRTNGTLFSSGKGVCTGKPTSVQRPFKEWVVGSNPSPIISFGRCTDRSIRTARESNIVTIRNSQRRRAQHDFGIQDTLYELSPAPGIGPRQICLIHEMFRGPQPRPGEITVEGFLGSFGGGKKPARLVVENTQYCGSYRYNWFDYV